MRRCIVLRDLHAARTSEPFGGTPLGVDAPPVEAAVPVPRVDVEMLGTSDVYDMVRDPQVRSVAPAMPIALIEPFDEPDAAEADGSWGIAAVGADASSCTGSGVVVSVLDTGIDRAHPSFAGVDVVEKDFSGSGNGDVNGHGTHCAGTVFGKDADIGRIGIARGVERALIGKVLGDDGNGSSESLFQAITWAVESGADVISMSLGFDFAGLVARLTDEGWPVALATSLALEAYRGNLRMFDALMALVRAGEPFEREAVVVAAAGNESRRDQNPDFEIAASLPAAAEGVVSVGALKQGEGGLSVASFSNTFPQISAPGVKIISAKPGGGTTAKSGTSMACPHVAGVAALWWEAVRASDVPPVARTVLAKVLASARTNVFDPGVDVADRGGGLVWSP